MGSGRIQRVLRHPYRVLIREIRPVTPLGMAYKTVVADAVEFSALVVAEGHGKIAARLRWRRAERTGQPRSEWTQVPMLVDPRGTAACEVRFDQPGLYEFEVQAWPDRFATWQRDLRLRADAGDNLHVEFAEGALILATLAKLVPKDRRARIKDTVVQLRNEACSERVKLDAALDNSLTESTVGVAPSADTTTSDTHLIRVDRELAAHGAWYEFFPRSEGGFVAGSSSWDRLEAIADAGFDVVYLPPIHPIGSAHRKGRDNSVTATADDVGSPWAIGAADGGHTAIHPDLGTLEDFRAFVGRARELGLEVALDYALQCSPNHPWVRKHPEWFSHRVDGSIRYAENPPKKYQDIYPINFWPDSDADRIALWDECRRVVEFWIGHDIKVFRVDNPHTKPLAFWQWLIAEVQGAHPEIVFLSEAFTDPPMMHSLAEVGFSQSYTYFTWRHSKWELTSYGEELAQSETAGWFRPNLWPNTPDILAGILRDGSHGAFAQRALLAATMSPSWGLYSGYELFEGDPHPEKEEYHYSEKYELYERDHDSTESLWPFISKLNRIRRDHPAFGRIGSLRFHHVDNDDVIAYSHVRRCGDGNIDRVLMVVNLTPDEVREATVHLDRDALQLYPDETIEVVDELTGETWTWAGMGNYVRLDPAERVGHVFGIVRTAGSLQ